MLSSYIDTDRYKVFDRTEQNSKVNEFLALLKTNEVQSFLKTFIDASIATSELKILKRLSACESILGLDDYSIDEDHEPTISERIQSIEDQIADYQPNFTLIPSINHIPTTKTEIRATSLIDHLKDTGKDHLTHNEIITFLKCKLPESCRIDDNIQNIRKVKQDVLKKAAAMYPNVFLNKKSTGHREVRLILAS
jgi:hypothetical protein